MNATERNARLEILAYKIWEEQGRPEGRHEENWAEAERRLRFEDDGLATEEGSSNSAIADALGADEAEDTPARSKPASSRQQTQRNEPQQAGSPELDSKPASTRRARPR